MVTPPKARPPARRRLPTPFLLVSGAFGFAIVWTYQSYHKALQTPLPTATELSSLDLITVWRNKHALEIDDGRDWDEWVAGITKLRKRLLGRASGAVLEAAAGTGKNFAFYDSDRVRSVTMVDVAPSLLEAAREKWRREDSFALIRGRIPMRFLVGDLGKKGVEAALRPIEEEAGERVKRFDTVVQTMGLCSAGDPVEYLRNLGRLVTADGQILLLEHGMSYYQWVNALLDHTAWDHAKKHGCWWNRDIGKIVEESGLEVEEIKRYNYGTTWWLILKPGRMTADEAVVMLDREPRKTQSDKWSWLRPWS
jgi:methyltransferase OMS1, mitochondrial